MRGEYPLVARTPIHVLGSPPHAWGIHKHDEDEGGVDRITPTCVGNTLRSSTIKYLFQDHPHMRGEYVVISSRRGILIGSPPHAWGILGLNTIGVLRDRITPTCVGNTPFPIQTI